MVSEIYVRFYEVIRQIPEGCVVTYGQIAILAGFPGRARQVGYALNALQDDTIPWHRVINAQGMISRRADPVFETIQRQLLEAEGIRFDENGRVPLDIFQWTPAKLPKRIGG
jgi:methylated-DNA-protein-cysteine methyltransferase-like protein